MDDIIFESNVILEEGSSGARITVTDGIIKKIEKLDTGLDTNLVTFPGFIDAHVHAREYALPSEANNVQKSDWQKMTAKETFRTAAMAALNGGVVLYAAMPNDPIPPDNEETYNAKLLLTQTSPCPVIPLACITSTSEPWGNIPCKLYLDHKPALSSFSCWDDVESALSRYSGRHVFFHAEDPVILQENSSLTERWRNRPAIAEISAVRRILDLTAKHGLSAHICHVSTIEAVQLIQEFNRASSAKVTSEVTPHHLFFSVDESGVFGDGAVVHSNRSFFDCNPPLRSERQRSDLLEALRDGLIDMVAGDHAPHTVEDKRNGSPGMPQLDTYGPFAAWLINRCGFSYNKIAEVFSKAPARLISDYISGDFGSVKVGDQANLTVLDLSGKTLVKDNMVVGRGPLQTRCAWSPFNEIPLPGAVFKVILNGVTYDSPMNLSGHQLPKHG